MTALRDAIKAKGWPVTMAKGGYVYLLDDHPAGAKQAQGGKRRHGEAGGISAAAFARAMKAKRIR